MNEKKKQELLERMRSDMLLFGKVCLPRMFSLKSPKFHREITDAFQNPEFPYLNIIAPRGHAKSSLGACVFPLHHLLFDSGDKFIVLVSKTEGHAQRLLQTIVNALEYSEAIHFFFGYWGEHTMIKRTSTEIILKDNTMILARGTGQMIRGLKHGDQRPTLIVLDDPEDENNTKTREAMEQNLRWFLQALVPARDPQRGRVVVIGTPQHERCMILTLSGMEGWKTLRYKALQDDGTALWPEQYPKEKLVAERNALESINKLSVFYREYQCEVIGDEDQLFKEQYFKYYEGFLSQTGDDATLTITHLNGIKLETPEQRPVTVFTGIDPASSTSQSADWSAIVTVAVDSEMNRFILPYYRGHVTPMRLAEKILERDSLYKPQKTRIESVGYQEMLREYIRSRRYIPGLEIKENPRSQKSVRLESLEPFFAQGKIYMQPDMQELKDELLLYPRGKHDDLLDALYYANKGVYPPSGSLPVGFVPTQGTERLKVANWKTA